MSDKLWQTVGYIALFTIISTLFIYVGSIALLGWTGLIVGASLLVVCSSVKLIFRRKIKNSAVSSIILSVFNAIATGLAISTYYSVKNISFGLFPALTCVGYNALCMIPFALIYDLFFKESRIIYVISYVVWMIIAIAGIVFLCVKTPVCYDAAGFQFIATGILSIGAMLDVDGFTSLLNILSDFSFIVATVVIIAVLIALMCLGGDGCDGCDCCDGCDGCDCGAPDAVRSTYSGRKSAQRQNSGIDFTKYQ